MIVSQLAVRSVVVAVALLGLAACESAPQQAGGSGTGSGGQFGRGGPAVTAAPNTGIDSRALNAAELQKLFATEVGDRVLFDTDAYALQAAGTAVLDRQAQWLKRNSQYRIVIEGHADERGTREYNLALAERRATTVRNYLVNQGIPGERLTIVSYGKERPAAITSDEAAWAQNRRAVTVLSN
jgi:peptidoglycan-associated lipoprotein